MTPARRLIGELLGTALLLAAVVGSGIMGERLSGGNVTLELPAGKIVLMMVARRGRIMINEHVGLDENIDPSGSALGRQRGGRWRVGHLARCDRVSLMDEAVHREKTWGVRGPAHRVSWPAIVYAAACLAIILIWSPSPVLVGFLIAGHLTWQITRFSQNLWARAAHTVARAVVTAGGILAALLLVFNVVPVARGIAVVGRVEGNLIVLQTWLHRFDLSVLQYLAVLALTAVLSCFLPGWKLATSLLWLRDWISHATLVVAILCSFTFTASIAAHAAHERIVARYRSAAEQKHKAEGRYVAAEAIQGAAARIDRASAIAYAQFFAAVRSLSAAAPGSASPQLIGAVVHLYAEDDFASARISPLPPPPANATAPDISRMPSSAAEFEQQASEVLKEETESRAWEERSGESIKLAKAAIAKIIGLPIDHMEGIAEDFFEAQLAAIAGFFTTIAEPYLDELADGVKEKVLDSYYGVIQRVLSAETWQQDAADFAHNLRDRLTRKINGLLKRARGQSVSLRNAEAEKRFEAAKGELRDLGAAADAAVRWLRVLKWVSGSDSKDLVTRAAKDAARVAIIYEEEGLRLAEENNPLREFVAKEILPAAEAAVGAIKELAPEIEGGVLDEAPHLIRP